MDNRVACRLKIVIEWMPHLASKPRLYDDRIDLPKKPDPPITNKLDIVILPVRRREVGFSTLEAKSEVGFNFGGSEFEHIFSQGGLQTNPKSVVHNVVGIY
jgi:hypothetical protein